VRKGEAESLVVADGREEAGAGEEKSSERRRQWRATEQLLLRAGERERERERRSASGSGGEGGRDRAHLVADQGASKPSHARHVTAELCRRATASRRGRPHAWTRRWRRRGEGGERGRAGPASASGPEVRPRPASAPFLFFHFFNFFSQLFFLNSFGLLQNLFQP